MLSRALLVLLVGTSCSAEEPDVVSDLLSRLLFPLPEGEPVTQSTNLSFHTRCGGLPQSSSCGNGGKHWGAVKSTCGHCSSYCAASVEPLHGCQLPCTAGPLGECCMPCSSMPGLSIDGPSDRARPGDCYQTLPNGSLAAPPLGIRSAAALGGLGTGSFALHGDGSFHEWTVEHARVSTATHWNGTTNPARVFLLADAFAGLRISGSDGHAPFLASFRTEPPNGVPAAEGMTYTSASPVTRLRLHDSQLSSSGVETSLYAHYRWKMGDSNASSTPAVTFTLQITNNRSSAINASLLLSMPLAANEGYSRSGESANQTATGCDGPIDPRRCKVPSPAPQPTQRHSGTSSAGKCQQLCSAWSQCSCWTWSSESMLCVLQAGRPPQPWRKPTNCSVDVSGAGCGLMEGVFSGLAGSWSYNRGRGLSHIRPGEWDGSGSITLRAVGDHPSYMTAETTAAVWKAFASGSTGELTNVWQNTHSADTDISPDGHGNGAASSSVSIQPGEMRSVSIVLAWYLPNALYTGMPLGVWYANNDKYNSSEEVADYVVSSLAEQMQDALSWNRLVVNTSLPQWLTALLVNTPATEIESGFWTKDGRYRQYDNIYAPDQSVHVHMFSMIPFVAFNTALVKDIVKSCQARLQCPAYSTDPACPPGMVQEVCANAGWGNLGCGNSSQNWCGFSVGMMDSGGGRIMGDVTSIFILESLQVWRQTADLQWLQSIWPSVIAAVEWEIRRSGMVGLDLPNAVDTTYDYLEIARLPGQVSAYSSFLYLLSLRAARVLAHEMAGHDANGAAALLKTIGTAESKAMLSIDKLLWVPPNGSSLGFYRAMQNSKGDGPDVLMSDSLHANMWSMILGFGPIVPTGSSEPSGGGRMRSLNSHFLEEYKRNCELVGVDHPVGCVGIAHHPEIGRHGSQDVSPSFSMDLTANLLFSRAWNASDFLLGRGPTTPAEIVTRNVMEGLHADFFNFRDMYFGPALWTPNGYTPEFDCHKPACRLKQPDVELHGDKLAGAPFENQRYSRQLSAWYIPLAISGQYWDASTRSLTFSPDLGLRREDPTSTKAVQCDEGEHSRFVLPFFFAVPQLEGNERTAAGHLEIPRCTHFQAGSVDMSSGRQIVGKILALRLLAGGPLEDVTVTVRDPRSGDTIAQQTAVTLLAAGDYALLGSDQ